MQQKAWERRARGARGRRGKDTRPTGFARRGDRPNRDQHDLPERVRLAPPSPSAPHETRRDFSAPERPPVARVPPEIPCVTLGEITAAERMVEPFALVHFTLASGGGCDPCPRPRRWVGATYLRAICMRARREVLGAVLVAEHPRPKALPPLPRQGVFRAVRAVRGADPVVYCSRRGFYS